MMCKLKGRMDKNMMVQREDGKGGIMMCKLRVDEKGGIIMCKLKGRWVWTKVEMGWMEKVAL